MVIDNLRTPVEFKVFATHTRHTPSENMPCCSSLSLSSGSALAARDDDDDDDTTGTSRRASLSLARYACVGCTAARRSEGASGISARVMVNDESRRRRVVEPIWRERGWGQRAFAPQGKTSTRASVEMKGPTRISRQLEILQ